MSTPLVTINIPTFNAESTIKETIISLLKQSYQNIEIHIIDNASTDKTTEIIQSFLSSKLKLIRNDKNIGAEANFEKCMRIGSGKYTAIYHADDVYDQYIVEKSVALFEKNEKLGLITTRAHFIDPYSKKIGASKTFQALKKKNNPELILNFHQLFKLILKYHNFLICPSAMVKSDIYKNTICDWRENLFKSSADLDVWLRITSLSSMAIINEPLINYRISKHHFSHIYNVKRTTEADFFKVIDHWLEKKEVKSFILNKNLKDYQLLRFEDSIKCCLHAFLLQDFTLATDLLAKLHTLYSKTYLVNSLKSLAFSLAYFVLNAYQFSLGRKALLPLLKKIDKLLAH